METISKTEKAATWKAFFFFWEGGGGDVVKDHSTGLQPGKNWMGGGSQKPPNRIRLYTEMDFKNILKPSRAMNGILGSVITVYVIYKPSTVLCNKPWSDDGNPCAV